MLTAVISAFHQRALSIAPLKSIGLWISIWTWERAFVCCCRRTFWWSVRRQPSAFRTKQVVTKILSCASNMAFGSQYDWFIPFHNVSPKCCKSHLFNNSFFLLSTLASNSVQQKHTSGSADQHQFLRPLHLQYRQFREVYSGWYSTLDSWSNAPPRSWFKAVQKTSGRFGPSTFSSSWNTFMHT